MTGIGRASGDLRQPFPLMKLEVEIRSYNHRFLDISVKMPNCLLPFESEIRREVQSKVTRGHIVVVIQQDREVMPARIEIDRTVLNAYLKLADELRADRRVKGEIDINTLLSAPGLVKFSQTPIAGEDIYKAFLPILKKAVGNLARMKAVEGGNIARAVRRSVTKIDRQLRNVERMIPRRNARYRKNLVALFNGMKGKLNEDRLYQEFLYAAERTDITEECKRLHSHLSIFKDSLTNESQPGRRLNFLLQEMQREANTLSVKANYLQINKAVVDIKEEIEKIREQVQNLE